MSINLKATMESSMQQVEAYMGNKLAVFATESYPCLISSISDTTDSLGMGGYGASTGIIVKIRQSLFTDGIFPDEKSKFTVDAREYRIKSITYQPTDVFIRMFCTATDEGA